MKKVSLFTGAALSLSSLAFAGSFQLNLQGMRQTAMGGSGVAWPWDASTIFYNPGGLTRLEGIQAYANIYAVSPKIKFVENGTGTTAETINKTSTPFALYVGGPIKAESKWGIGLGIYTPFGSSANWGDNWTGRYVSQSIALQSVFVQPTLSYKISEAISVGAGFVYGFGSVEITKAIPVQDANGKDGQATLEGNANGVGFNVGVQIKANENMQLGISYRSGVNMKVNKGNAKFDVAAAAASNFPDTRFDTELPLPSILTIGAGFKVNEHLTIQGDVVLAGWEVYDSLKFDFEANTPALQDTREPRIYQNTFALRVGGHYKFNEHFAAMIGGAFDPTPSKKNYLSPDAVDANRYSLSGGITVNPIERLSIMAVFNYTTTAGRAVSYEPANLAGTYQIKSFVPAFGIAYTF
ncbi:MAG: outer membrane protein transport protein [Chitinophagaceae bacterium]|jgi:long-chain fatty acid transport protein